MNGVISGETLTGLINTESDLTGVLTNPKNIDLSSDTITPSDLKSGVKAHDSTGTQITGSMVDNGAVIGNISTKDEEYTINEGYHNGNGKVSIDSNEQDKIIPGNIKKDVSILGVTGTLEAANLNWSAIGYSGEPKAIQDGYDYAVEIMNNWTPRTDIQYLFGGDRKIMFFPLVDTSITTRMVGTFQNCSALVSMPLLNTSNVTSISYMFQNCTILGNIPQFDTGKVINMNSTFYNCTELKGVPILNTEKVTNFSNTFTGCISLTDESVDNILQMCKNATSYSGTKTLSQLGFKANYYPTARIQALPHYQDFINAGWTIGY